MELRGFAAIGMIDGDTFSRRGHAAQSGGGGALDELIDEGHFAHDVDGGGWWLVAGRWLLVAGRLWLNECLAFVHIFLRERDDGVQIYIGRDGRKRHIADFAEAFFRRLDLRRAPVGGSVVGEVEEHGTSKVKRKASYSFRSR